MNDLPIGIFDSGVGGLTVFKSIRQLLPHEKLIYLGDTARVPYGTKSPKVVQSFSLQITRFLETLGIKALVVACHTASATALANVQEAIPIPVIGVIEPAVKKALQVTENKNVGVIATKTTITSNSFQTSLAELNPSVSVTAVPAPLLVPLVEEGWLTRDVTRTILREYIAQLKDKKVDTCILGCTHYPLLKPLFQEEFGEGVSLVEPSEETASYLKDLLMEKSLLRSETKNPEYSFYVTDDPEKFSQSARLFLGEGITTPTPVDLELSQ